MHRLSNINAFPCVTAKSSRNNFIKSKKGRSMHHIAHPAVKTAGFLATAEAILQFKSKIDWYLCVGQACGICVCGWNLGYLCVWVGLGVFVYGQGLGYLCVAGNGGICVCEQGLGVFVCVWGSPLSWWMNSSHNACE